MYFVICSEINFKINLHNPSNVHVWHLYFIYYTTMHGSTEYFRQNIHLYLQ